MVRRHFAIALFVSLLAGVLSCPPPSPPPPKDACASISIPAVSGPASGSQAVCTLPTSCRDDSVVTLIDDLLCNDKSKGSCPAGTSACQNTCAGTVLSSGLKVTANSCTWDRNSECKTASGQAGSFCTCQWTIPAGAALQCGCGCK